MIEPENRQLPLTVQCQLLSVSRSSLYYRPVAVSPEEGMVSRIEVTTSCIDCGAMNVNDVAAAIDKEIPDFAPGPPEVAEKQDLADAGLQTVASLPPKYRVSLTMFHLDGLSYETRAKSL